MSVPSRPAHNQLTIPKITISRYPIGDQPTTLLINDQRVAVLEKVKENHWRWALVEGAEVADNLWWDWIWAALDEFEARYGEVRR